MLSDLISKLSFTDDYEKSLISFNNWVFGISIGIYAILIFQMKEFNLNKYAFTNLFFKILVIYSMITVAISGITKYHLFVRENKLSQSMAAIKKLVMLKEHTNYDKYELEIGPAFQDWANELEKVKNMTKFVNLSIKATGILIAFFSIFLLILIL